ncbi:HTH domain-containing protein [Aureispira sp. CCB-E]|uniref:HTH domain-containing protein n=1 Tax=Aureispira sp. CCB-E TaxID=3051121 RepID=UPI002868619A|nr:HTH domain-containing protein [Aureispira sp. CCB-E]WMX13937.1 HTH domain-containing protein [Aureispira sp. CCB-E]
MTYLELAYRVLEETQRLLWVDDIWRIAKEKGYIKELEQHYENEEDNINFLDNVLYKKVGQNKLRLLEEKGLYYLVDVNNLAAQIETALYGSSISSYQEILTHKKVKHFSPSTRGFDGMVLFFLLAVGFPVSLYISTSFYDGSYLDPIFIGGTVALMICFAIIVLVYLQLTNCDFYIHPDKIEIYRTFFPKNKVVSILIKDLVKIEAWGLGTESQINSDFKSLVFTYQNNGTTYVKKIRCHGYINPSTSYDPFSVVIRNFESFATLRVFLQEICAIQNIPYQEK